MKLITFYSLYKQKNVPHKITTEQKANHKLIEDLAPHNPLIISGLAYGIDVCAHKAALKNNLSTVGVLAHGLDRLYPAQHKGVANQMLEKLKGNGISGDRLNAEGYGKKHPLCPANDTKVCQAKNRRIDVKITSK